MQLRHLLYVLVIIAKRAYLKYHVIYKYKTEYEDADDKKVIYREGEMKITPCDKLVKEIKKE